MSYKKVHYGTQYTFKTYMPNSVNSILFVGIYEQPLGLKLRYPKNKQPSCLRIGG